MPGRTGTVLRHFCTVHLVALLLRRLLQACLSLVLMLSLAACSGSQTIPPTISADDMTVIIRQAEGYVAAMHRLPELAALVSKRDWIFTRSLIHGPMQEVGREMLYINNRLLPADRPEAGRRAKSLKRSLAELDEAARLQEPIRMDRAYTSLASTFAAYSELIPEEAIATIRATETERASVDAGLAEGLAFPPDLALDEAIPAA